jgi:hypothetical protein
MASGPEIPNFKQYSMKAAGSSGFLHNPARNKLFPFKKTEKRQGFFRLLVACVITAQPPHTLSLADMNQKQDQPASGQTMPAATVLLLTSSITMKLPVAWLRW